MPTVHDSAVPGTSQQSDVITSGRSLPSTSRGQFEVVFTSATPATVTAGAINPVTVPDTDDLPDMSVFSPRALMESATEQVETSSWLLGSTSQVSSTKGEVINTSSHTDTSCSSRCITQGSYLQRTARRKRTIAALSDISQAADLRERLEAYDWSLVENKQPKRRKFIDTEQKSASQASPIGELTQSTVVSITTPLPGDDKEKHTESELSPGFPFSTGCSSSITCRPFTPPNGTSTPVTKLSPEDASTAHTISPVNCGKYEESLAEEPNTASNASDIKECSDL